MTFQKLIHGITRSSTIRTSGKHASNLWPILGIFRFIFAHLEGHVVVTAQGKPLHLIFFFFFFFFFFQFILQIQQNRTITFIRRSENGGRCSCWFCLWESSLLFYKEAF